MLFDRDSVNEIAKTLMRNKSRSFLTGFGVFWGLFMLLVLIGGGQGAKDLLSLNFQGFATNSAFIFPQKTGRAFKGFQKNRKWRLTYSDAEKIQKAVPELKYVSPLITYWGRIAVYGTNTANCALRGAGTYHSEIEQPVLLYGRFLNEVDSREERKVCIIGKNVYNSLFPKGGNPCGEYLMMDGIYYQIVGVDVSSSNINLGASSQDMVTVPLRVLQKTYNLGEKVDIIALLANDDVSIPDIKERVLAVVKRAHYIDPSDDKSLSFFNLQAFFGLFDNLMKGMNLLVLLVGLGTILAGMIGVSNIMMVTVKERTTEIGIRRAIGATPNMILSQIIMESIILTLIAGCLGILVSVFILELADKFLGFKEGLRVAYFQVDFWIALASVVCLTVLGITAGLAPAYKAMSIKPVDAMRNE